MSDDLQQPSELKDVLSYTTNAPSSNEVYSEIAALRDELERAQAACAEIESLVARWRKEAEEIMEAGDKAASLFANRLRYCADMLEHVIGNDVGSSLLSELARLRERVKAVEELAESVAVYVKTPLMDDEYVGAHRRMVKALAAYAATEAPQGGKD